MPVFAKPCPRSWIVLPGEVEVMVAPETLAASVGTVTVNAWLTVLPLKSVTTTLVAPPVAVSGTVKVGEMLPVAAVVVVLVVRASADEPVPRVAVNAVLAANPPPVIVMTTFLRAEEALREIPGVTLNGAVAE